MLTRNIDIQNGLVNGAFGKLLRVVHSENDQHIIKLGLKMDNETSGKNNRTPADDMVYIERAEENLKQKGVVRRQFPVKLAFACTIHKVQGMTTTSAVVSLKSIFEPGMAYVAVSRVTSLSGLYLLDMEEKKIFTNPEITAALENMRQANLDDMMPLLHVRQTLSRSEVFTIVHHNTEGLPAHINDIKSHHELCLADVLCLTETHLRGSFVAESLHLENYNLFKRNRHLSYTNFPQMANRSGGGVAVYVKSDIQVHEKQYIHNVTDLEFLALKVEAPVSALIAVVYRPPDYTLRPFLKNLLRHSGLNRLHSFCDRASKTPSLKPLMIEGLHICSSTTTGIQFITGCVCFLGPALSAHYLTYTPFCSLQTNYSGSYGQLAGMLLQENIPGDHHHCQTDCASSVQCQDPL
ncbi:uncharacterized protein LOC143414057 isoform X1 [Maylandia zebra]